MGKLRDRMEEDLKLGGYSPATQRIYLLYAREFTRYPYGQNTGTR